jgi:hypothetical protein
MIGQHQEEHAMKLRSWSAILAVVLAVSGEKACADFIVVTGDSNIYGAGHATAPDPAGLGGGIVPPSIAVTGSSVLTFQVSGLVSYNGGGNYYGGDGGFFGPTDILPYGGISGTQIDFARYSLVGVFLTDQEPSGSAPPAIDFASGSFTTLAPGLNQVFFIGDGLTGTGTGTVQQFIAPSGATRLFLGFADGFDFSGYATTYGDDIGSLDVTYTVTTTPAPASFTMAGIGVACLMGYIGLKHLRHRRAYMVVGGWGGFR